MIIGLDIGGSKITGIVFDGRKSVHNLTVDSPKNLADFKSSLKKLLGFLSRARNIGGIGIGIPGAADNRGRVVYAPNIRYLVGLNFVKFFKASGFKKIKIENDANCFALAEAKLGRGRALKNFVGITLGTGIGGGLISDGQIYRGINGSAGEVGHMMASHANTYEYYFQKYRAAKNYAKMGELLGRLAADLINMLDVEGVIIGGSVAYSARQFVPAMVKEAKKHILNPKIKPNIKVSKLKHAGALGAALLFDD